MTQTPATVEAVIAGDARWHLHCGDSLHWLASLPDGSLDGVITDPPYSSGGQFRGDRMRGTNDKYVNTENRGAYEDFAGDTRDQRGFLAWCSVWLAEALRATKPGGLVVVFTDWRQLPTVTDAVQSGGWVWRGIVPWVKAGGAYRVGAGFPARCEYAVWGTKGPNRLPPSMQNGAIEAAAPRLGREEGKVHPTQKPLALMSALLSPLPPDAVICDPFVGSGTTGAAALGRGMRFLGCEMSPHYHALAEARLRGDDISLFGAA